MEKKNQILSYTFNGYFLPNNSLVISIIGIFAALICVFTLLIRIPVPATTGYINIGDFGVMFTGLLFGPIIGGIAGGLGPAIADIIGFPQFALPTLIIKGLEGFFVGLIANPKKERSRISFRDVLAVLIGGSIMVIGYFVVEIFMYGLSAALIEIPGNLFQLLFGVVASLIFIVSARRPIVNNLPQVFDKIFIKIK
jgi:uncharacterized membrane protein